MTFNPFKNWFTFAQSERKAIILLSSILAFSIVVKIIVNSTLATSQSINKNELDSIATILNADFQKQTNYSVVEEQKQYSTYDLNKISENELIQEGIHKQLAQQLVKYREKIGPFQSITELKKLYSMTEKDYNKLLNLVYLAPPTVNSNKIKSSKTILLELNTADSIDLLKLKGIGPVFAKRIIAYRKILGGYITTDQLKEIYGFKDSIYFKIFNSVYVDISLVKKIAINNTTYYELAKHPYINNQQARDIIYFTEKGNRFTDFNLLQQSGIFNDSLLLKVKPYLDFK